MASKTELSFAIRPSPPMALPMSHSPNHRKGQDITTLLLLHHTALNGEYQFRLLNGLVNREIVIKPYHLIPPIITDHPRLNHGILYKFLTKRNIVFVFSFVESNPVVTKVYRIKGGDFMG